MPISLFFKINLFILIGLLKVNLSFSQPRQTVIYIYNDDGVSQQAFKQTEHTLKKLLPPPYTQKTIDALGVRNKKWHKNAALFVMPGGADRYYHEKLKGKGNEAIKQFVAHGGAYLGICAGAYYGSQTVVFDKGGPLEVIANRELAFFPGDAIGPVLAKYDYNSEKGARAAKLNLMTPNKLSLSVFYNGGNYFANVKKDQSTKVVAYYQNKKPAILFINYGKGKVLLSGVHFEYDPSLLDKNDPYLKKLIPELTLSNSNRLDLLKQQLRKLLS